MGIRKILYTVFAVFITGRAVAQQIGAADIYYKLLDGKRYLVTAVVYRQCDKDPLNKLEGFVIADTFKIPMQFVRTSISKINDTCGNPCNIENEKSRPGFEKHVFEDTVNLLSYPYKRIKDAGHCEVYFAIHQKLRDSTITTHSMMNGMFYLDAMVNSCLRYQNISSPRFSNDPKMIYSCNFPVQYTPGPLDTFDFDSMSFSLENVRFSKDSFATYYGSYKPDIPVQPYCPPNPGVFGCRALTGVKPPRGFYFDENRCFMIVTPTNCSETGSLQFRAKEWRKDSMGNYILIGYVSREMINRVSFVHNNLPPMFYSDLTTGIYKNCYGAKICFNNILYDDPFLPYQITPDTTHLEWNHGVPGAEFRLADSSARVKNGLFCWTPDKNTKPGNYHFSLQSWDMKCNSNISSHSYIVSQYGETKYKTSFLIDSCNLIKYRVSAVDSFVQVNGTVSISDRFNNILFTSQKMQDSFTLNTNGTHYIRYRISNVYGGWCHKETIDTFEIYNAVPKGFVHNATDTNVCFSHPATLGFHPSKIPGIQNWAWYRNDTLFSTKDTGIVWPIQGNTVFRLKISDNRACVSESIRNYNAFKINQDLMFSQQYFCPGDLHTLGLMTGNLSAPFTTRWIFPGLDTTVSGAALRYTFNTNTFGKVWIKDKNHCTSEDIFSLSAYYKPELTLSVNKPEYCADSLIEIEGNLSFPRQVDKTFWSIDGKDTLIPSSFKLFKAFHKESMVVLRIQGPYLCTHPDTIYIKPISNPEFELLYNDPLCYGDICEIKSVTTQNYQNRKSYWDPNGNGTIFMNDSTVRLILNTDRMVRKKVVHDDICILEKDLLVKVNELPAFKISGDSVYDYNSRIFLMTDKEFLSYSWSNGVTGRYNDFWASELGEPDFYCIHCTVTDSNFCKNNELFCFRTVRQSTELQDIQSTRFNVFPNPAQDEVFIELPGNASYISLFGSDGSLLLNEHAESKIHCLPLTGFSTGIYTLRIISGSDIQHVKLYKQ